MGKIEAGIQTKVYNWLVSIGCKVIKTVALSKSGNADLVICFEGYYVEFEMKQPGEEATELQAIKGQDTIDAKGAWFVIHSLEEAKKAIKIVKAYHGLS